MIEFFESFRTLVFHWHNTIRMNRNFRHLFLLLLFSGISLSISAFTPKSKPGINDKTTTGTGSGSDGNEVKLPVGIPFQLPDQSPSSGSATDENGIPTDLPAQIVYTFDLPDGVGPESVHETHSAFQQARSLNAACVLIHMNSFSNALDAADNINSEMLDYDRPVMVYVNNRAIPASYLISMAAENKNRLGGMSRPMEFHDSKSEKHISTSKNSSSSFSSRNQISSSNFSSDEISCTSYKVNQNHILNSQAANLDDVLQQAGMDKFKVVHYSAGFFSNIIDWCMNPFASLLLVLVIAFGMRIQTRSVFPGPATFLLMVGLPLFGVPLFMGGLASAIEIGSVFILCALLIGSARKNSTPVILKMSVAILFILALSLCQTGNFGGTVDFKIISVTFLLSALAFLAGWFAPSLLTSRRRPDSSVSVSSAI